MRVSMTSAIAWSVTAFQPPSVSLNIADLEQKLNHPAAFPAPHCPGLRSLSWSGVLNCIPLAVRPGWTGAASASPASPLYPDTLRRYLSASGPSENDAYSAEVHSPGIFFIWKHVEPVVSAVLEPVQLSTACTMPTACETISSATAEIARVGGHYAVQGCLLYTSPSPRD